jgi:SpoVK/Ycf46/Vps4 family AAA+-type ATPase
LSGDQDRFLSVAGQLAAHEARQGHGKLAQEISELIDAARGRSENVGHRATGPVPLAKPKGELSSLLHAEYSTVRLNSMVLGRDLKARVARVLTEQRQQQRLRERGLAPRRKILLVGPPGSGKTMTAQALAGELKVPLFTVLYDGLIGKMMGETASRLRLVFDAAATQRGVYFFDEFDAIGGQRASTNDVGEMRRVLNSFLQFLEKDDGPSLLVAATNHPEILDKALFRRFDDVIMYGLPTRTVQKGILEARLASFDRSQLDWKEVLSATARLSQAELTRAADEAAKMAVLKGSAKVTTAALVAALHERASANL